VSFVCSRTARSPSRRGTSSSTRLPPLTKPPSSTPPPPLIPQPLHLQPRLHRLVLQRGRHAPRRPPRAGAQALGRRRPAPRCDRLARAHVVGPLAVEAVEDPADGTCFRQRLPLLIEQHGVPSASALYFFGRCRGAAYDANERPLLDHPIIMFDFIHAVTLTQPCNRSTGTS
jgi:hypothetical protein